MWVSHGPALDAEPLNLTEPRALHAPGLLGLIPGVMEAFRDVPAGYWRPHGSGSTRGLPEKARVECPCGNRPVVRFGQLTSCRELAAAPHRCSRMFLFLKGRVLVAGGPRG
jgi:hypothetical protein